MFAGAHLGENIVSAGVSLFDTEEDYQSFKANLKEKVEQKKVLPNISTVVSNVVSKIDKIICN